MIKKALIWLVSCVCLLSFGAVGVFGETVEKDGLDVTFEVGEKESYEVGEEIPFSLIIANHNNFDVEGVSIEDSLPEGFEWAEWTIDIPERFGVGIISAGDSITISGKAVKKVVETTTTTTESTTESTTTQTTEKTTDQTTEKTANQTTDSTGSTTISTSTSASTSTGSSSSLTTSTATTLTTNTTTTTTSSANRIQTTTTTNKDNSTAPKTGDNFNILWLILGLLGLGGSIFFIVKGRKNGTKFMAILLCISLLGTSFGYKGGSEISADELESLTVSDTITIENSDYTFTVTVKYKSFAAAEIKLTGSTMDIECGEGVETVYFYAEYGGNVDNLMLESDGGVVELMYDNGENGDEVAGDNIFTCAVEIDKSLPYDCIVWYYAVSETGLSSDGWQIFVYELPTEEGLALEETVSNAFSDLTGSEEFVSAEIEQRKEMVEILLAEMVAQGYIDEASIEYNEEMGWYKYVDTGAKYQHLVVIKDNNGTAGVGVDIYYGAEDAAVWENFTIEPQTENMYFWNEIPAKNAAEAAGCDVSSKADVTVRDIYNLGIDNNAKIIYISAHGGYEYHNKRYQGGWVIDEIANSDTDGYFSASLAAKRIAKTTTLGSQTYYVYADFLNYASPNWDLKDAIILCTSCSYAGYSESDSYPSVVNNSMWKPFKNAGAIASVGFYNSVWIGYNCNFMTTVMDYLLTGYTVSEGFESAVSTYGEHDNVKADPADAATKYNSYPIIQGNRNATLKLGSEKPIVPDPDPIVPDPVVPDPDPIVTEPEKVVFSNGNFESGLEKWGNRGGKVITSVPGEFGELAGSKGLLLSTAYTGEEQSCYVYQNFEVETGKSKVRVNVAFISDEPKGYDRQGFNDKFYVEVLNKGSKGYMEIAVAGVEKWANSTPVTNKSALRAVDIFDGDNEVYYTGFTTLEIDLPAECIGEEVSLYLGVMDIGDSYFDSAAIVKSVEMVA